MWLLFWLDAPELEKVARHLREESTENKLERELR